MNKLPGEIKYIVICLFAIIPGVLLASGTKLSMKIWNRYTAEWSDDNFNKSEIAVKRGYLRLEPEFSENIDGRFNLDFFSDNDGQSGAGLKLKYVYLNFKDFLPLPDAVIKAGLIKHYFGNIYDWEYRTVAKALEDYTGVASSADYGAAILGGLPGNYGKYAFSLTNGEGYKMTGSDIDMNPEFLFNLRLEPVSGIEVGGSVLYEGNFVDSISEKRYAYAGIAGFSSGPVEILGEYLFSREDNLRGHGFMIMGIFALSDKYEFVGRYDNWDPNSSIENNDETRIIGGINWNIVPHKDGGNKIVLQLQGEKNEDRNRLLAQIKWKFSNFLTK